jgi:AcrR family transcriptional regulator
MTHPDRTSSHRSRRERPAKPALTREGIIEASCAILRDEGLARVTMRRVAAALDTGHASLYVYVRNTEDLHTQILDALLGEISPTAGGSWRDRLKALLKAYQGVLFQYPEIARMAMSTQPTGPNYLALTEAILALLTEGGVADRAAAWGVDLLLLYPTAIAVERSAPRPPDELSTLAELITSVDPVRHPHLTRLGTQLTSGAGPDRFDWAFDVLLDGMLAASSDDREPS